MTKTTRRPETIEEALQQTGRPVTPAFTEVPEDLRDFFSAVYEGVVAVEALNKGERPSWDDPKQKKWLPWMWNNPAASAGFAFYSTTDGYSYASAGDASRLCCKTQADAEHFGKTFTATIDRILRK